MKPQPGDMQQRYHRFGLIDLAQGPGGGWWITIWPPSVWRARAVMVRRDRWYGLGWFGMLRIVKEAEAIR